MKIHLQYQAHFNMRPVGKYTVASSIENSFIELSYQSKLQIVLEVGIDDVRKREKIKGRLKEAA